MENELQGHFVSPQVHADRRVTFRLRATQAKQVLLDGLAGLAAQAMTKNADGVWELTLGPLAPEIYSYQFIVDGMPVIDPHNRRVKKWLSLDSLVEVPGDPPLLHQQQMVPHGVLQQHIYWSTTTKSERNVLVYVPPGYAGEPAERYPLVVLLHGYGDDESAWTEVGRAHWIADNLLAQGNMRPSIIAMPYGHPLPIDLRVEFDVNAREKSTVRRLAERSGNSPHLSAHRRRARVECLAQVSGRVSSAAVSRMTVAHPCAGPLQRATTCSCH